MRRVLSTTLAVAAVVAFTEVPASAQQQELPLVAHGYTDVRAPAQTFTGDSAPVGAWRGGDGQVHSAKAYFTVDLTPLRGKKVLSARAHAREITVTDCGKPRSVELWRTAVAERPTWAQAPQELTRVEGGFGSGCPDQGSWDLTTALTGAVASGAAKATFALRMAGQRQHDVSHGRRYTTPRFEVATAAAATEPRMNDRACGPQLVTAAEPLLRVRISDPGVPVRYVVTDVATPAKRYEGITAGDGGHRLPAGFVEHGRTYEWTAGAENGVPSTPCRFTGDLVAPATPPVVTSPDFPQTGAGFPGRITFDAGGDGDVAGFAYEGEATGTVQADRPGGTATISVIVPGSFGDKTLRVRSVDTAGNTSAATTFTFRVRSTAVYVFGPQLDEADLGETYPYWFTSDEPNVTHYVYRVNGGPEITVPVPCTPCSGEASIRVTSWHSTSVSVRARTAEGYLTEAGTSYTPTRPSWPLVEGGRDEIRIYPPYVRGITEYRYRVNGSAEVRTVAATAGGTASVRVDFGTHPNPTIEVWGRTADDIDTEPFTHRIS